MKILSDEEVDAIEELIRAAIRWTDTPGGRVISDFALLMADYRRLRKLAE